MNNPVDLSSVPDQEIFDEFNRRMRCSKFPEQKIILFGIPSLCHLFYNLLGPPGTGKGTQGSKLAYELCSCHISTGDLLRYEIQDGTDLGKQAKDIMRTGALVPDSIVLQILQKKLDSPECKKGAVFDGFPRTFEQAKKLDETLQAKGTKINKVYNFQVDEKDLLER